MKKLFLTTALSGAMATSAAMADPVVSVGVSISFGGNTSLLGVSGRILSDDARDEFIYSAGATYYPGSGDFGLDAGIGYNVDNTSIGLSYDFLNNQPLLTLGWADLAPAVC